MHTIKGTVAGLIALIACPCHLPLTLPALLLLTSGTAAGVWLATHQWFVWLASFVLFAGGVGLAILWMSRGGSAAQCEAPQNQLKRTSTARRRSASNSQKQLAPASGTNDTRSDGAARRGRATPAGDQTKEVSHV